MFVCALRVELFLSQCHSLKEKRAHIRPIVDGLRHRFSVSVAEVSEQDKWQRAVIAIAVVSGTMGQVDDLLDACERFIWSFPEIEVTSSQRGWLEDE